MPRPERLLHGTKGCLEVMCIAPLTHHQKLVLERVVQEDNGCWIWYGYLHYNKNRPEAVGMKAYGMLRTTHKNWWAHILSFEAFRGPVPRGMTLDHVVCDTPRCVNPWHLEPATRAANTLRGPGGMGHLHANQVVCLYGHPFEGDNLMMVTRSNGKKVRVCRTCKRRRAAEGRLRAKAG